MRRGSDVVISFWWREGGGCVGLARNGDSSRGGRRRRLKLELFVSSGGFNPSRRHFRVADLREGTYWP
jgi:hypothetical protein